MTSLKYKKFSGNCESAWSQRLAPNHPYKEEKFLICLALLSFSLFCFTTILWVTNIESEDLSASNNDVVNVANIAADTSNYVVIVDCGSSGSRVFIYTWPKLINDNSLLLPDIKLLKNDQGEPIVGMIEPGLDIVQDDLEAASKYMGPVMDFVASEIPECSHDDTHVYIMAAVKIHTLGRHDQQKIMADLENDLTKLYKFRRINAQVITGKDEAMYSWLAVNYKAGLLNKSMNSLDQSDLQITKKISRKKTAGIIEMGRTSVQVAFEMPPKGNDKKIIRTSIVRGQLLRVRNDNDIVEVNLGRGDNYRIFVSTFLGLGSESIREASTDLLVRSLINHNNGVGNLSEIKSLTLLDPCLPRGASESIKRPRIVLAHQSYYHQRKKKSSSRIQTIGFRRDDNDDQSSVDIVLKGSGSMKRCMIHLAKLIDVARRENMNCDKTSDLCSMPSLLGENFVPFDNYYHFYGLGDLYYSTREMIDSAGIFNRNQIVSRTNRICLSSYSRLQSQFSHAYPNDPTRVLHECFKATWLLTFLEHGLGMPKLMSNFETVNKIKNEEVNWTFGAAIEKSTILDG